MKRIYSFILIFLITGCATLPAPIIESPQASAIGIQVKTEAPVGIFTDIPDRIFFVKIDNDDSIKQNQIIPSNYAKDGRVYLLNANPGQYAAVAAFKKQKALPFSSAPQSGVSVSFSVGSTGYTTYFPRELIEATRVNVGSSEAVFMGSYVVKQTVGLKEAEPIQYHYAELLSPGSAKSGIGHWLSGDYHYRGSVADMKNDDTAKQEFLEKSEGDLREGGWAAIFEW